MPVFILFTAVALGSNAELSTDAGALADALDKDFHELLQDDRHAAQLRLAARSFAKEQPAEAFKILRQVRSRAGVPLLLNDMLVRKVTPAHLSTLTALTGEDAELWFGGNKTVEDGIRQWWLKRKKQIVTDPAVMSAEQLELVAGEYLRTNESEFRYDPTGNDLRYQIDAHLYDLFSSGFNRSEWPTAEELHPALIPAILRTFGWHEQGAGPRDAHQFGYTAIPLLSALRKNMQAPQLEKVAADEKQNSVVRMICLLALAQADEGMNVRQLMTIYAREHRLERRLICLLSLQYADNILDANDFLLESMDDKNVLIRTAVVNVLKAKPLPTALPRLQALLKKDARDEPVLYAISRIRNRLAKQVLADYVEQGLNSLKPYDLYIALWAFQDALGQSYISAGSYTNPVYLRQRASEALAWWRQHRDE